MNGRDEVIDLSRRAVLFGFAAGTLLLATGLPRGVRGETAKKYGGDAMPHGLRDDPVVFVAIDPDGTVTLICHRAEMGQGVRTSLPMVIADELEADWTRVKVVQAPGDEPRFGNQNTDGSRSMRHHFDAMRRIGAATRRLLEEAAASRWQVPVTDVRASHHAVIHADGERSLDFGALAETASRRFLDARDRGPPQDPVRQTDLDRPTEWLVDGETFRLKSPAEFRYIGRPDMPLVDNLDFTTGRAQFGIDTRLDDMVYAVIARPPVLGGRLRRHDEQAALNVPGVLEVLTLPAPEPPWDYQPLGGVAVVGVHTWAAIAGRRALAPEWEDGPNAGYSTDSYREALTTAAREGGKVVREQGDVEHALSSAARRVEAEYYIPHHAQAPMEPPAAVARFVEDRCEVWAPSQDPQGARERLARALELDLERITLHQTLLGGGFGRKSKSDFVTEAALLSRALGGRPVKLTWTREDDLANGYPNTVSVQRIEAGLDAQGRTVAWRHRSVAPTITSLFDAKAAHEDAFELGMGFIDLPFAVPHLRLENPAATAHTRIGWARSVFNVPHAFAVQCFACELAAAAGRDHRDYLLDLIGPPRLVHPMDLGDSWNYGEDPARYPLDTGRLRRVIEEVTARADWSRARPAGHGLGLAAHRSFVTYTAVVVEVAVAPDGSMTVPRVDLAIDCGPQINPERVRAQMEGAIVQGVGLALSSGLHYEGGQTVEKNFDRYLLPRMHDAPFELHVHPIAANDFDAPLGGVGEPGLPPVAPAVMNAIFAATGKRVRDLPLGNRLRQA